MRPSFVAAEAPELLNPFDDDPSEHLTFDGLGMVLERTERGHHTIETCGLWRPSLVIRRAEVAREVEHLLESLRLHPENTANLLLRLLELGDDARPFAGVVRARVQDLLGISWPELRQLTH